MQYRFELVRPSEVMEAGSHYNYICREGKYEKSDLDHEDLCYKAHGNIPSWAKNSCDFWKAADEECNGKARRNPYIELRLSLQEELSAEENIKLVEDFLEKSGIKNSHAYSYAIHDKVAAFENDHRNIHCHLMFNEKIIEQDRPLDKEYFFKKYSSNKEGKPVGGYRTDKELTNKPGLKKIRKIWEECINKRFEANNLPNRVDCRTLWEQRVDLIEAGKIEEAELLNRKPMEHLGPKFLNPKIRNKISTTIEFMKNSKDYEIPMTIDENSSDIDKKIYALVQDVKVRMIARNIQKERLEALNHVATEKDFKSLAFDINAPFIITVKDVIDSVENKKRKEEFVLLQAKEIYEQNNSKIIPQKQIGVYAVDKYFKGEYKNNLMKYKLISQKYDELSKEITNDLIRAAKTKKQFPNGQTVNTGISYEEILIKQEEQKRLQKEKAAAWAKVSDIKQKAEKDEVVRAGIQNIVEDTLKTNAEYIIARNKAFGQMKFTESKIHQYENKLTELKEYNSAKILYSHKMPKLVTNYNKLYGSISLEELQMYKDKTGTYYILPKSKPDEPTKAIRLYDEMPDGKATVYIIQDKQVAQPNNAEIKPQTNNLFTDDFALSVPYENLTNNISKAKIIEDNLGPVINITGDSNDFASKAEDCNTKISSIESNIKEISEQIISAKNIKAEAADRVFGKTFKEARLRAKESFGVNKKLKVQLEILLKEDLNSQRLYSIMTKSKEYYKEYKKVHDKYKSISEQLKNISKEDPNRAILKEKKQILFSASQEKWSWIEKLKTDEEELKRTPGGKQFATILEQRKKLFEQSQKDKPVMDKYRTLMQIDDVAQKIDKQIADIQLNNEKLLHQIKELKTEIKTYSVRNSYYDLQTKEKHIDIPTFTSKTNNVIGGPEIIKTNETVSMYKSHFNNDSILTVSKPMDLQKLDKVIDSLTDSVLENRSIGVDINWSDDKELTKEQAFEEEMHHGQEWSL